MKIHYLPLILFLLPSLINAQIPKTLDSMEIYLRTKPKDSTYTKVMKDCAFQYLYKGSYSQADSLGREVEKLSKKIDFSKGIFYHYLIFASIANYKSETRKSLEYFLKGLEIVEKNNLSKFWLEASLNNVAISYEALNEHDNALKYALKAIEVEENNAVANLDGSPYEIVGKIYQNTGKYEQSLKYYEISLKIATNNHLANPKTVQYINEMAVGENTIGNLFDLWKKPKEAKLHFQKGLELAEKVGSKLEQTDLLTNLGNISKILGQYDQAESYYKRSEKICEDLGSTIGLQTVCGNLGDLYLFQKKYELAENYYQESLKLAQKLNLLEKIRDANESLAKFYAETKNFQKAYHFSAVVSSLKDSVSKIETFKKSQELLTKYETEKKEAQIELLQKEAKLSGLQNKATLGGSTLILLLLLISGAFIYNRNKLKQLEETQKLRNKISADLHDEIGSTLSSISLLSGMTEQHLQQNQPEKAGKMMQKIYIDSQQVMESMDDIIWTVNPQNDALSKIFIRLKEFAQPLVESRNIDFEFTANLATESLTLPMEVRRNLYLIVKEAINNLVKYSEATKAKVSFEKVGKYLQVNIQDNGKGFDSQVVTSRNGLKNMQQRANDIGGELIINSALLKGTSIIFSVNLG